VDTVSLCLSKGLGAPIGSVLAGPKDAIQLAKHYRKAFGGGWRQAGILAAAGLHAIEHHWSRMAIDHENATILARGIEQLGLRVVLPVESNQVWVDVSPANVTWDWLSHELRRKGLCVSGGGARCSGRLVTHLQTPRSAIDLLLAELSRLLASASSQGGVRV